MRGTAYGVGVGPGDPELMTLKAVRVLQEADVVAAPAANVAQSVAYAIALQAVPEIAHKKLIGLSSPMTHDRVEIMASHCKNARLVEQHLDAGQSVALLTLGDPTIYSTFGYMREVLAADGYDVQVVSGVPSFCAAAARLGVQLATWDEPLHVIPSAHGADAPGDRGTCVLMKGGRHMREACIELESNGHEVWAVEKCGLEGERAWHGAMQIPADIGYLSLAVARPLGEPPL